MKISLDYGVTYMSADDVPAFVLKYAWAPIYEAMMGNGSALLYQVLAAAEEYADEGCTVYRRGLLASYLEGADRDLVTG